MEEEEPLQPRGLPRQSGPRRPRRLDSRTLQELQNKTPEEILLRLGQGGGGLDQLLKNRMTDNEIMLLLLRLIRKSFTAEMLNFKYGNIQYIVEAMLQTDFLNYTLYLYVANHMKHDDESKKIVVSAAVALVDFAMSMSPKFAGPKVVHFPPLLKGLSSYLESDREKAQLKRFESAIRNLEKKDNNEASRGIRIDDDGDRAEETFRELPLIPTQRDLSTDHHIFVRRNRQDGGYDGVEDYLDVQFRLFRADLLIPLRESISKYLGAHDVADGRESGRGLRVYNDVQILRPVCSDRYLSYRLSFNVTRFSAVDWRTSQRLKFGSLLCLSCDNFQNFLCAAVHERDPALLSNGLVDVVFSLEREELRLVMEVPRDQRFVMVESPAYFEAYRHVLQGLVNLNDHNFPFDRYIVHCQPDVNPPRYLQRGGAVRYDFRPLLEDDFIIRDRRGAEVAETVAALGIDADDIDPQEIAMNAQAGGVEVLSARGWPSHDRLKLDESQYQALHSALTKELAIVQGPPGTGKTYLGLKILKMLLHNSQAWNDPAQRRPLLVVCYTNHALDQFLEGLLPFFQGKLVRVGGQSKSDLLKERTLSNYRMRARNNRQLPMETHEAKVRAKQELAALRIDIHEKAARLEMAEQEVVREDFLKDFISFDAMRDFRRSLGRGGEGGAAILRWLKLEMLHERLVHQAEHRLDKLPPPRALLADRPRVLVPVRENFEDEFEDDEDDDETIDVLSSFVDTSQSRRLDDDDDDFLDFDIDFEEVDLEREETESQRLRRLQREMEVETRELRKENIVLDVSGFSEDVEEDIRDRTVSRSSKAKDKEVNEELRRLVLKQKARLQTLLRSVDKMSLEEAERVVRIWDLKPVDRWRLYRHWVDLFCKMIRGEIRQKEEEYFDKARKYREILDEEDRFILQNATVIGMTTTGAARYQAVLHAIGPRVVVVEEAAEVFEAHVVVTLSAECQHLILIGDHKQLRPNPTVYDLAKKCHLDLSLFERMVCNRFPLDRLDHQHRMRPEISSMLNLPELYPELRDHEVVMGMANVKGVQHNVYYISHSRPEDRDEETKSCSNVHEADFLVALCDYLLKQGYRRSQITILTPYSGQVHLISKKMPRREFEGVRVSSVDNYQGEENDLILLSLVRSNNDNDIGFLKMNNRICVALSRAKMGLYVIGNFEALRQSGTLLESVVTRASAEGILGDALPLCCQNHPREAGIMAAMAKDFKKAPEGGCRKRCDVRLRCGHQCTSTCHPNVGHEGMLCPLPCVRQCADCGQRCEADHACCDHTQCDCLTEKVIPRCDHVQPVPCGTDPIRADCQAECRETLQCGHQCQNRCGQPCTHLCQVVVTLDNPHCEHKYQAKCSERDSVVCSQPCGQELLCGHRCQGTCGQCKMGRLHVPCEQPCSKFLVCGHDCKAICCQCPPCSTRCQNRCSHSRCEGLCGEACVPCAMPCDWQCQHHTCSKLCGEPCDRQRCNQPCRKTLPDCHHPCIGLCGETCPPVCRICDLELLKDSIFGEPEDDDRFVLLEDCCHVLEVTALDRWVDASRGDDPGEGEGGDNPGDGAAAAGEEGGERPSGRLVKLPECPQCRTAIRRNQRYGNVVKKALQELEIIKERCRGNQATLDRFQRKVEQAKTRVPQDLRPRVEALVNSGEVRSETRLATQFYQITLGTDANQLIRQVSSAVNRWPDLADTYSAVQSDLQQLLTFALLPRNTLSDQEHFNIRQEFSRLRLLVHLLHCRHSISSDNIQVEPRLLRRLAACIRQLMTAGLLPENDLEEARTLKEELKEVVADPYSALTDEEREEIVRAVKLPTGSWYACPRGHYYVIGECGRPTEVGSCPECRSAIGGQNHALVRGNRQAPEFDKAEGPVWTEERDLEYALTLQQQEFDNWH